MNIKDIFKSEIENQLEMELIKRLQGRRIRKESKEEVVDILNSMIPAKTFDIDINVELGDAEQIKIQRRLEITIKEA